MSQQSQRAQQQNDVDDERLCKVVDVARFLSVSRACVYAAVGAERIPYVEVGGHPRFVPSEIKAWALSQRRGADPR